MIKPCLYALTALFLFTAAGKGSQVLTLTPKERLLASISATSLNRLEVENDRISKVFRDEGAFVTRLDKRMGRLFIKPTPANGTNPLALTLITEKGVFQRLMLDPKEGDAATLILKEKEETPKEDKKTALEALEAAILDSLEEFASFPEDPIPVLRNFLMDLYLLLLGNFFVSNVFLAILAFRKKKPTPLFIKERDHFSPSYVRELALYITHLILDVKESSFFIQEKTLLNLVTPNFYEHFKYTLFKDLKRLTKDKIILHFSPRDVKILEDGLSVKITGDLMTYVDSATTVEETYHLKFINTYDKLLLESFTKLEKAYE